MRLAIVATKTQDSDWFWVSSDSRRRAQDRASDEEYLFTRLGAELQSELKSTAKQIYIFHNDSYIQLKTKQRTSGTMYRAWASVNMQT